MPASSPAPLDGAGLRRPRAEVSVMRHRDRLAVIDADLLEARQTRAGLMFEVEAHRREIGELLLTVAACDDVTDALLELRTVTRVGLG